MRMCTAGARGVEFINTQDFMLEVDNEDSCFHLATLFRTYGNRNRPAACLTGVL